MKADWIILGNSCAASIYTVTEKDRDLKLVARYLHEAGRLKNSDLVTDSPGHYEPGSTVRRGARRGSYAETTDPKHQEIEQFVKALCSVLETGRISKAYNALIVVAEPHFFGLIQKNVSHELKKLIKHHLLRDYTHYSEKELKIQLKDLLKYEIGEDLIT